MKIRQKKIIKPDMKVAPIRSQLIRIDVVHISEVNSIFLLTSINSTTE